MKLQKGFTLIEVLIYASILAITAGLLTAVLTNTVRIKSREANSTELSQQLNFVLGTVQSLINESAVIESVYETGFPGTACSDFCTLKLRMTATSTDPTFVHATADGAGIYLTQGQEGPDTSNSLTGTGVTVDHFELTKYEFAGGHASVRIDMALTIDSTNPQFAVTRSVQSAIGRVTAAVFDDHLLPNAANSYDVGQTSSEWRNGAFSGNVTIAGALDLTSIASGFLLPRVTTVQRDAISSPGAGSLVYNSTTGKYNFFNTVWNALNLWTASSTAAYYNDGNVGIGTDNPTYTLDVSGSGRFTSPVVVGTPIGDSDAATKAYVDASGGSGYTECYAYAVQANESCPSPFTTIASTAGTGCDPLLPSTAYWMSTDNGLAYKLYKYTSQVGHYCRLNERIDLPQFGENYDLTQACGTFCYDCGCGGTPSQIASSVNVCCK